MALWKYHTVWKRKNNFITPNFNWWMGLMFAFSINGSTVPVDAMTPVSFSSLSDMLLYFMSLYVSCLHATSQRFWHLKCRSVIHHSITLWKATIYTSFSLVLCTFIFLFPGLNNDGLCLAFLNPKNPFPFSLVTTIVCAICFFLQFLLSKPTVLSFLYQHFQMFSLLYMKVCLFITSPLSLYFLPILDKTGNNQPFYHTRDTREWDEFPLYGGSTLSHR